MFMLFIKMASQKKLVSLSAHLDLFREELNLFSVRSFESTLFSVVFIDGVL